MTDVTRLFFELIQIAVGNRMVLSRQPAEEEWHMIFAMATRQSLLGIVFAGIEFIQQNQGPDFVPSLDLSLEWLWHAEYIRSRNEELDKACSKLTDLFSGCGFRSVILKGQGNLCNYGELGKYRSSGDIDILVWSPDGPKAVIDYIIARYHEEGLDEPRVLYHHIDWHYCNIPVEVHFRASWMNCPWDNVRFQRWTEEMTSSEKVSVESSCNFPVPTADFNAVYQLVHIYRHLFDEGIGMRQLLDYYFVLKHLKKEKADSVLKTMKTLNLTRFAESVMYVLKEVFAMPDQYRICEPDEGRGRFLLSEILMAGNFGQYDERNTITKGEGYLHRFVRRQKRIFRFVSQYPEEVIWSPYFSMKQRMWRILNGYK